MTPLNEKAREYAQREFCQIGYCGGETPCLFNANLDYEEMCGIVHAAYDAYIAGYTEALRWRDVNVELPEPKTKGISDNVLLKYSVSGLIHDNAYECCVQAFYCHNMEMWHPLMPLDDEYLNLTPIAWRPIETI